MYTLLYLKRIGLPWWFSGKESACQCRRHRSDPWPGRSHIPGSNQACALLLLILSLRSKAWKPQLSPRATPAEAWALEPMLCTKRSHSNEKPVTATREKPPVAAPRKKPEQQ